MFPKYKVLANQLRSEILSGMYADGKLPTEESLATAKGISRHTVRQAIALLSHEGLIVKRQGSGTYVETKPCQNRNMRIRVICTYISEYIFPSIVRGIEEVVSQNNYTMELSASGNKVEQERKLLLDCLDDPPDGLIIEGTKSALPNPNIQLYNELKNRNIPFVFINGYYHSLENPIYIVCDDYAGGKMAVEYLHSLGCKKIAGIFKSDDLQGHLRYAGFAQALFACGLSLSDNNVLWYTTENREVVFANAEMLLSCLEGCDAVLCYNDEAAIALLDILSSGGIKSPEDMAIISFDNSMFSELCCLTSLEHPKEEMGRLAANKLLNMILGGQESSYTFDIHIVKRNSTNR